MTTLLAGGYGPALDGTARGITRLHLDPDGRLTPTGLIATADSPSWSVVDGARLYAAGEGDESVSAWTAGPTGLARAPVVAAGGGWPCHLALSDGELLTACYGGGVLGAVPLRDGLPAADAAIAFRGEGSGPHAAQDAPHVHGSLPLADGRVLVADLGTDEISVLRREATGWGRTGVLRLPPGSGPRDLALVGEHRVLVLTELGCGLVLLDIAPETPVPLATLALPGAETGDHAAALALQPVPGGVRVHSGLRGTNRIGVALLAGDALEPVGSIACGGDWPRNVTAVGDLLLVSNQLSGDVAVFGLADDALPAAIGAPVTVPSPTQTLVVPDDPWSGLPVVS